MNLMFAPSLQKKKNLNVSQKNSWRIADSEKVVV